MTVRNLLPVALILIGACSQPKDARGAPPHTAAASYDVAGVAPGMSVDTASKALKDRGFAIEKTSGQSWANAVAIAVARARGAAPPSFDIDGGVRRITARKGSETISIEPIRPGPDGGIVMFVGYSAPLASHPMKQVEADSVAKFGAPTRTYPDGSMLWCASGPACNVRSEPKPWLKLSEAGANAFLSLEGGTALDATASKVLADAVAAQVGRSKSSF